jgi:hypothetical protein
VHGKEDRPQEEEAQGNAEAGGSSSSSLIISGHAGRKAFVEIQGLFAALDHKHNSNTRRSSPGCHLSFHSRLVKANVYRVFVLEWNHIPCCPCLRRDSPCIRIGICYTIPHMKIGLDIHGVIDTYPDRFKELSEAWDAQGHEVYIITGEPQESAQPTVDYAGVLYDDFFSIVDYHVKNNTPSLNQDENGHYWVDRNVWLATKGDYARRIGIDIHFDDQLEYAEYFPKECAFIYVPRTGFDKVLDCISLL